LAQVRHGPCGRPVGTHGAYIDAISGTECEDIEAAETIIPERLVMIPGGGLHTLKCLIIKENISENLLIDLLLSPWSKQKITHRHLLNLQKIKTMARKNYFQFFLLCCNDAYLLVIEQELSELLGEG